MNGKSKDSLNGKSKDSVDGTWGDKGKEVLNAKSVHDVVSNL